MTPNKLEKLFYARFTLLQTMQFMGTFSLIIVLINISSKGITESAQTLNCKNNSKLEIGDMKRTFKFIDCTKQDSYYSSVFERSLVNPLVENSTLKSTEHIIHWYRFCLHKDEHWLWIQSLKLQQNLCGFHSYKSSYASMRPEIRMWTLLKSQHDTAMQRSIHHLQSNDTLWSIRTKQSTPLFQYPLFIARHNQHLPVSSIKHFVERKHSQTI